MQSLEKLLGKIRKEAEDYPINETYHPNLIDMGRYFEDAGVVGEDSVTILAALGLSRGLSFSIEGPSGSGKTRIADAALSLFDTKFIYQLDLASDLALMKDAALVNKAEILYIPELQKALKSQNPNLKEIVKSLTEGKDATRRVSSGKTLEQTRIKGDIALCTTLAAENSYKHDQESWRRLYQLFTHIEGADYASVLTYKAQQRYMPEQQTQIASGEVKKLKHHMNHLLVHRKERVINPFANYLLSIMPTDQPIVCAYIDHFLNLIEASTLFHKQDRKKSGATTFTALDDVSLVHHLYKPHFEKSLGITLGAFDQQECMEQGRIVMKEHYPKVPSPIFLTQEPSSFRVKI